MATVRKATFNEMRTIISEQGRELAERLHVPDAQMSIPTDGRGLRIRMAVRKNQPHRPAADVELSVNGNTVVVPVEFVEDYQDFMAL